MIAISEYPCILTWSNGEQSKTNLGRAFSNESDYERYAEYQRKGKPYPIKIEAETPAEPQKASSIFDEGTLNDDFEAVENMCRGFTESLIQYLIRDRQSNKFTNNNIPNLERAEFEA